MAAEVLQLSSLLANMRCTNMAVLGNPRCYINNARLGGRNILCCEQGLVFSAKFCRCVPANLDINSVNDKNSQASQKHPRDSKMSETVDAPTAVVEIPPNQLAGSGTQIDPKTDADPNAPKQQAINNRQPQYVFRSPNPLLRPPMPRINIMNIRQRNGMILRMPVIYVVTRNFRNRLVRRALPIFTIRNGQFYFSRTIVQRYPSVVRRVQQLNAQGIVIKPTFVQPEIQAKPSPTATAAGKPEQLPVVDRMSEKTEETTGKVEPVVREGITPVIDSIQGEKKEPEPNMNEFPFVLTTRGGNTPIDALTGLHLNQPFPPGFVLPTFEPPKQGMPPPPSDLLTDILPSKNEASVQ